MKSQKFIILKNCITVRKEYLENIVYFSSSKRMTFIHLVDNRTYAVNYNLKQLEDMLPENGFYRISRQIIVNVSHIKEIYLNTDHQLILMDNNKLTISIRRKVKLLELFYKQNF